MLSNRSSASEAVEESKEPARTNLLSALIDSTTDAGPVVQDRLRIRVTWYNWSMRSWKNFFTSVNYRFTMTMVGPSPEWVSCIGSFSVVDQESRTYHESFEMATSPLDDAGTEKNQRQLRSTETPYAVPASIWRLIPFLKLMCFWIKTAEMFILYLDGTLCWEMSALPATRLTAP